MTGRYEIRIRQGDTICRYYRDGQQFGETVAPDYQTALAFARKAAAVFDCDLTIER